MTSRSRAGFGAALIVCASLATSSLSFAQNPIPTPIPHGPVRVGLQPVATGLISPDRFVPANDGSNRQFIVDQTGQVRVLQNGALLSTPFLNVNSRLAPLMSGYDERGLLGMAFDPGFADPASPGYRRVFTYTSETANATADFPLPGGVTPNNQSVVASWRVSATDPNVIDPSTRTELIRMDHPQFNHNGGDLHFGPDGMLYISQGDGGGANDGANQSPTDAAGHNPTIGNGQDNATPLGKLLRIDPNGTNSANGRYGIPASNPFASGAGGAVREIYAMGFRNPYRFSFDGNRLLVADVGQNNVEELDDVVNGGNYGWRYKEGTFKFNPDGTVTADQTGVPAGLIDPIAEYDHDEGLAIVGGFVYHGSGIPELDGSYVFGDFGKSFSSASGRLFYADLTTGQISELIIGLDDRALGLFVKGFGIDQAGELYVLGSTILGPTGTSGVAMKIVAVPEPATAAILLLGAIVTTFSLRRRVHSDKMRFCPAMR